MHKKDCYKEYIRCLQDYSISDKHAEKVTTGDFQAVKKNINENLLHTTSNDVSMKTLHEIYETGFES